MLLIILLSLALFCVLAIFFILRKAYKLDKEMKEIKDKFGEGEDIY
jgi:preprotein translocase subunit YajC